MDFKKTVYIICTVIIFCVLLTACEKNSHITEPTTDKQITVKKEVRGVWLTCYDLKDMLVDGSEAAFRAEIEKMLSECKKQQINTVFIQVRPFADSVYPSAIFPLSDYVLSSNGRKPEFDILSVFIELADNAGIEVHAWINPYRVSYKTEISELDKDCTAFCEKYKSAVVSTQAGIYLNPCLDESRRLVLEGIREILENYSVSGIHIDDYFYPLTDESFDKTQYTDYCKQGGTLELAQWRRENVNSLVSSIYYLVHSYGEDIVFSISPAGDIEKNYSAYYADVKLWMREKGYADIIIPQIYYGFEHEKMPFEKTAEKWLEIERARGVEILCGLAAYKQGTEDELAGKGIDEWVNSGEVIERQKEYVDNSLYGGYVLFSYKYIIT